MSDVMDKIIADIVEGARRSEGFMRGSRAGVEIDREPRGREEKLASMGGALGGLAQFALRSPVGGAIAGAGAGGLASLISGDDHPLRDMAIGAGVGGLHGNLSRGIQDTAGSVMRGRGELQTGFARSEALAAPPAVEALSQMRARPGSDYEMADKAVHVLNTPVGAPIPKNGALSILYSDGSKAATARLGIKEAILPLIGSLLGGTALRAGVGALARGAGGSALGGIAGKVAPRMAGGIGGAATDMVGSMAGGAIGNRLQGQQGQQGV